MKIHKIYLFDTYLDPKKMTQEKPSFQITKNELIKEFEKTLPKNKDDK